MRKKNFELLKDDGQVHYNSLSLLICPIVFLDQSLCRHSQCFEIIEAFLEIKRPRLISEFWLELITEIKHSFDSLCRSSSHRFRILEHLKDFFEPSILSLDLLQLLFFEPFFDLRELHGVHLKFLVKQPNRFFDLQVAVVRAVDKPLDDLQLGPLLLETLSPDAVPEELHSDGFLAKLCHPLWQVLTVTILIIAGVFTSSLSPLSLRLLYLLLHFLLNVSLCLQRALQCCPNHLKEVVDLFFVDLQSFVFHVHIL